MHIPAGQDDWASGKAARCPPRALGLHNPMPPLRKCLTSDSRAPAGLHVDAGWGPLARLKVGSEDQTLGLCKPETHAARSHAKDLYGPEQWSDLGCDGAVLTVCYSDRPSWGSVVEITPKVLAMSLYRAGRRGSRVPVPRTGPDMSRIHISFLPSFRWLQWPHVTHTS